MNILKFRALQINIKIKRSTQTSVSFIVWLYSFCNKFLDFLCFNELLLHTNHEMFTYTPVKYQTAYLNVKCN